MAPKFGTSGLRGLVVELTDALVADHVRAFLTSCVTGGVLYIGRDLRDSSAHLASVVQKTARDFGVATVDCGALPTPALALAAMRAGAGAVMVTGSHIPADRNGLKFYTTAGEITKADEAAILANLNLPASELTAPAQKDLTAADNFKDRYLTAFGAGALSGARIGVYSHSSVARDMLLSLLADLGAEVVEFGRATGFVPVDTEAVSAETRAQLLAWAAETPVDAIISTDGDADRPLLTDAKGEVVSGDILGQITARYLGADVVVTPVSSNTGAELGGHFAQVVRCKIGSPFVIAAMEANAGRQVVGYEANGGFLLGFDAQGPAGPLAALPTRDCVLPILAVLAAAKTAQGIDIAARIAQEPQRFTASDRIENTPTALSQRYLAGLTADVGARADLLGRLALGAELSVDLTDGLRMTAAGGQVVHLRPSGNAPEFRIYVEAGSSLEAKAIFERAFALIEADVKALAV